MVRCLKLPKIFVNFLVAHLEPLRAFQIGLDVNLFLARNSLCRGSVGKQAASHLG